MNDINHISQRNLLLDLHKKQSDMSKYLEANEALEYVKSNDRIFIHSVAAAPQILIDALTNRAPDLENVELVHLHTECNASYLDEKYSKSFKVKSFFVGSNVRRATQLGIADYIPVFLSEIPKLIKETLPIDVALVQISPPDKHGYCSLGVSVDATHTAVSCAKLVIAQVNKNMPRTYGDGMMHISNFDYLVEHDCPIHTVEVPEPTSVERRIGSYVAGMVDNGATLQMGIGAIPNAVLASLTNHKKLGIHTEMFSDGVIPLVEKGIITGELKKLYPERIVSAFIMGTQKLYDFVDDNPGVMMMDVSFTNDVSVIRKNPKVTSINSAIEIDLTGQVCADSIGIRQYSGVGGQIDFIRGASYSEGGKPIIALSSVTNKGASKIVPVLKEGAGVVSTRANVHYIATEYGIADLYGKSLQERARMLINISHPDHREELEKAAYARFNRLI
ncbi:MAG: acetyl-CoA hydrolase/transferase C-terminal domain-containing protein [Reichenbachiella sp.]|uniref:acetyl-CoA hydrolase/transferase family protein n=1 Tax=Reichenbachiella sp. TaxID=2184521 RepID=UPI003266516A